MSFSKVSVQTELAGSKVSVQTELAGRTLTIETGHLASQANGAVTVRYGDSMVLVTAVAAEPREGVDFFPLIVEFEEKMYAAGRIPGVRFTRREGRPGERAILSARLIDRSLRPFFPEGARNEVQVIVTALSSDGENYLDLPGLIGASAALHISDIPFGGPIAAVRIGLLDGDLIVNPTHKQLEHSKLDLVVAGTKEAVVMMEAGADKVSEELMLEAIRTAHEAIKPIIQLQEELRAKVGKPKTQFVIQQPDPELVKLIKEQFGQELKEALQQAAKSERENVVFELNQKVVAQLLEEFPDREADLKLAFSKACKETVRRLIIDEGVRPDGRKPTDIRPLTCQVGLLPRTHGSGLFMRGETQVLTIATLGATTDEMFLDTLMEEEETKRFMHQYNFPPFSTGEVRPLRAPSRREIGHGALAEKALEPVIPDEDSFPYTIRLVSEVLSSNGSTSMASVCGSTLSLMDAGVPISAPVAGISIGLIKEPEKTELLTDIQGIEDFNGDMDFKVAGTREGITAIQLDLKIQGLPFELVGEALQRAKEARLFILDEMAKVIDKPKELSRYAPRIVTVRIPQDKIGDVIGPRGKHIRQIEEETDAKIEVQQDGTVFITCPDLERAEKAKKMVMGYAGEVEVGVVYKGRITRLNPTWALVEILPGKEGLLHISEWSWERTGSLMAEARLGDEVEVKVLSVEGDGRIRLSRKETIAPPDIDIDFRRPPRGPSGGRGLSPRRDHFEDRPTRRR